MSNWGTVNLTQHNHAERSANTLNMIEKITRQDRDAFRELYLQSSAKLFGVAMRIVKDADKASDVLQDAYLQIWRNLDRFDKKKGTLEGWMVGVVRFRAIDALRRDRVLSEHVTDGYDLDNYRPAHSANESRSSESAMALWGCIDRLSDDQRMCILDAHFQGYTHEELSTRHKAPLGTIKSRIKRGLFALKECMDQ